MMSNSAASRTQREIERARLASQLVRSLFFWGWLSRTIFFWSISVLSTAIGAKQTARPNSPADKFLDYVLMAASSGLALALLTLFVVSWRESALQKQFDPSRINQIPLEPKDYVCGMRVEPSTEGLALSRPGGYVDVIRCSAAVVVLAAICAVGSLACFMKGVSGVFFGLICLLGFAIGLAWILLPKLLRVSIEEDAAGWRVRTVSIRWGFVPSIKTLPGVVLIRTSRSRELWAIGDGHDLLIATRTDNPWAQWQNRRFITSLNALGLQIVETPKG